MEKRRDDQCNSGCDESNRVEGRTKAKSNEPIDRYRNKMLAFQLNAQSKHEALENI